eukprot:Lankesteria_metandrocarpae@DN695_c0_g1_i1.p1
MARSRERSRDSELATDGTLQNVQYAMRKDFNKRHLRRVRHGSIPGASTAMHSKLYSGKIEEEDSAREPNSDTSTCNDEYYRVVSSALLYKVRRKVVIEIYNGSRRMFHWTSADILKAVRRFSIPPERVSGKAKGGMKRSVTTAPPYALEGTLVTGSLTYRDLRQVWTL